MNSPALVLLIVFTGACREPALETSFAPDAGASITLEHDGTAGEAAIDSLDEPATLDAVTWNLEWYGHPERGPEDESKQQSNVARALSQMHADLYALVEVVTEEAFDELLAAMPGYHGVLVTDPSVDEGAAWYWDGEQKVALILKERFSIASARVVLTEHAWSFGGRPPLEVILQFREEGEERFLTVLVVHFKAMATAEGHERRSQAALALRQYLEETFTWQWGLVIGDFNDDLELSTYLGAPSPLLPLSESDYRFTTDSLSLRDESTTVHFSATVDHHLATRTLAARFVEDSAEVIRLDEHFEDFGETTSDHYPVLGRYDLR